MVLISKHIQSWKEVKGQLITVESWSAQTFRHLKSVTLGACALGSCLGVKSFQFPMHLRSDFVIPQMITDQIGRHELLLPLNKIFRPRAVKTDAFPASFDKSKSLTSCRRQFPEGCFSSRAL